MPIYRLMRERSFDQDAIERMVSAYETACAELQIKDRTLPAAELLAAKIIDIAQMGERDGTKISERAIRYFREHFPGPGDMPPART